MARSIHAADIHLGYKQYGSNDRWNDFGRAFAWLVDEAIRHKACCLRISGDVFHGSMEPRTLLQATANLQRAKQAGIAVLIIEGNHDRARYSDRFSWLDYLVEQELLILLDAQLQDGEVILAPWDQKELRGSYYDCPFCGTRTIGVRYYGASTPVVVDALARALAPIDISCPPYTILMLHAGIEGMLAHYSGGLTMAEIEPLRPHVHYLALGHIHKPFVIDNWIHNPGCLESCSIDEAAWEERGYFLLETDADRALIAARVRYPHRRSFLQFSWPVDAYEDPERLYAHLNHCMADEAMGADYSANPVLELRLEGLLRFDRSALDMALIEGMMSNLFQPVVCRVRDLTESDSSGISVPQSTTRAEVEWQVIQELVQQDGLLQQQSEAWASMVLDLKDMALRRSSPEDIIAQAQGFRQRLEEKASC